jgi:nitroreductase
VKERVKRALPAPVLAVLLRLKARVLLRGAYAYDRRRFDLFSSTVDPYASQQNLASRITETYHNLEKGLSLPAPRPGFGVEVVARLVGYVQRYVALYGSDYVSTSAIATLASYRSFNLERGLDELQIPSNTGIVSLMSSVDSLPRGGVMEVRRDDILRATEAVGAEFFESRVSVRDFAAGPVDVADIEFAVRAAQKAPAVCNRQYSRVYLIDDPKKVQTALRIQGGARGFADHVAAVAVITTNLRNFWTAGERMQPWTDGGMFSMSFVLGLHARGLGSVCLNWSKTASVDRAFRDAFDLPEEEVIVMLVAIGPLPEQFRAAVSPRAPMNHALRRL